MEHERLPGRARTYAVGVFVSLIMVGFCVLLGVILTGHWRWPVCGLLIVSEPEIVESTPDEFDFKRTRQVIIGDLESESQFAGLNQNGREIIRHTCLVDSGNKFGSGFVLRANLLVTAAHVITRDIGEPVVIYCEPSGNGVIFEVEGQITAIEREFDVAFVSLPTDWTLETPVLPLQSELPGINDQLHMFGFQFRCGTDRLEAVGVHRPSSIIPRVVLRGEDTPRQTAFITGLAQSGNSGGPVFANDGSVVGMMILNQIGLNRSVMVPAATIESLLRLHNLDE
ncbi:serine protease [Patescibacteria group bacterium]|nr:serine protease [Patescibacteria group bacterium]MBU1916423.1 serine protease [Patescibacteria group bacterium]